MKSIHGRYGLLATALCGFALAACNAVDNGGNKGDFAASPIPNVVLRGTVTGLGGKPLVLQNNGANDRSFTNPIAASTSTSPVTFGTVTKGSAYKVTVKTQPFGRICTVDSTTATGVANADVTNLAVNCIRDPAVPTYVVSGTVGNLVTGATGLKVKLTTEEGDEVVAVPSGGTTFVFATKLLPGFTYTVSVGTKPAVTGTSHNCSVTNGTGAIPSTGGANVTNVALSCSFTIGGAVTFPLVFGPPPAITSPGVGLALSMGGPAVATVNATSTSFQFPGRQLSTAAAFYTVAITAQPPGQTCVLKSGGGAASVSLTTPGDVTSIALACTAIPTGGTELTGTYRLGRNTLTFFANGTILYGYHPAAGGAAASGVEQGLYAAGFFGANSRFVTMTTDTNGAAGLFNNPADGGYISLINIAKTATDISFSTQFGFPATTLGPFTYTVANATSGKLTGAWATADTWRVFVYNSVDGTGYHMAANGAPSLQDVCLTIANPASATGTYVQNRSTSCAIAGGVVDSDPTATLGGLYGLPGAPPVGGGANPSIGYTVTTGSPDTLVLQPTGTAINWTRSSPN